MIVQEWQSTRVEAELERRRSLEDTYTRPLGMGVLNTDPDFKELQQFMSSFYVNFYTVKSKKEREEVLKKYPEVCSHFQLLVPFKVTEELFWERYGFRCDQSRILRERYGHCCDPNGSPPPAVANPDSWWTLKSLSGRNKNLLVTREEDAAFSESMKSVSELTWMGSTAPSPPVMNRTPMCWSLRPFSSGVCNALERTDENSSCQNWSCAPPCKGKPTTANKASETSDKLGISSRSWWQKFSKTGGGGKDLSKSMSSSANIRWNKPISTNTNIGISKEHTWSKTTNTVEPTTSLKRTFPTKTAPTNDNTGKVSRPCPIMDSEAKNTKCEIKKQAIVSAAKCAKDELNKTTRPHPKEKIITTTKSEPTTNPYNIMFPTMVKVTKNKDKALTAIAIVVTLAVVVAVYVAFILLAVLKKDISMVACSLGKRDHRWWPLSKATSNVSEMLCKNHTGPLYLDIVESPLALWQKEL